MSKSAKKLIPGNCCCFFCGSYVFKTNIPETDSLKAPEKSSHVSFSIVNSRQGGQIFVPGGVIITHLSEGGAEKHPKLTVRTWKSKVGWKTIRLRFGAEIWPIFRNELAVSFGFWVWIWCVSRFYRGKFCPFSKNHCFGELFLTILSNPSNWLGQIWSMWSAGSQCGDGDACALGGPVACSQMGGANANNKWDKQN